MPSLIERWRRLDKLNLFKKLQVLNLVMVTVIFALFALNCDRGSLKTQTAFIKIDTRKSTVNDIIGSFTLQSDASSEASDALASITDTLNSIEDKVTFKKFNLARVFSIHDRLLLGASGYYCYSGETSKDDLKRFDKKNTLCPVNGFTKCLGINAEGTDSLAYQEINKDYLASTTSFTTSEIDQLSEDWLTVYNNSVPSSRRLNLSDQALSTLIKYACKNDYEELGLKHSETSISFIPGFAIGSIVGSSLAFLIAVFTTYYLKTYVWYIELPKYILWLASFALSLLPFIFGLDNATKFANQVNKQAEGFKVTGKNNLIFTLISVLNLHLVVAGCFVMVFIYYNRQKSDISSFENKDLSSFTKESAYNKEYDA